MRKYGSLLGRIGTQYLLSSLLIIYGSTSLANLAHQPLPPKQVIDSLLDSPGLILMNRPGEIARPEIAAIEARLKTMLKILIEREPKAAAFDWRINVYRSEQARAFADLLKTDNPNFSTYQQLYHFNDARPIAQISFTAEFLRKVESDDELFGVLAHEFAHHIEGHTTDEYKFRVHAQSCEAIADEYSVQAIAGKYRLDALLNLLTRFSNLGLDFEKEQAAAIGVSNKMRDRAAFESARFAAEEEHPQIGVRLALLQTHIEELKRKNASAAAIREATVSGFQTALNFEQHAKNDSDPHILQAYEGRLKLILQDPKIIEHANANEYATGTSLLSPNPILNDADLKHLMDRVDASHASKSTKALALYISIFGKFQDSDLKPSIDVYFSQLGSPTRERFRSILEGLDASYPEIEKWIFTFSHHQELSLESSRYQSLIGDLAKTNPAWKALIDYGVDRTRLYMQSKNSVYGDRYFQFPDDPTRAEGLRFTGPLQKLMTKGALTGLGQNTDANMRRLLNDGWFPLLRESDEKHRFLVEQYGSEFVAEALKVFHQAALNQYQESFHNFQVPKTAELRSQSIRVFLFALGAQGEEARLALNETQKLFQIVDSASTGDDPLAGGGGTRAGVVFQYYGQEHVEQRELRSLLKKLFAEQAQGYDRMAVLTRLTTLFGEDFISAVGGDPDLKVGFNNFLTKEGALNYLFGRKEYDIRSLVRQETASGLQSGVIVFQSSFRLRALKESGALAAIQSAPDSAARLDEVLRLYAKNESPARPQGWGELSQPRPILESSLLMDWTLLEMARLGTLEKRLALFDRSMSIHLEDAPYQLSLEQKRHLSALIGGDLKSLTGERLVDRLKKSNLSSNLIDEVNVSLLKKAIEEIAPSGKPEDVNLIWRKISEEFRFTSSNQNIGHSVRDGLAADFRVQPSQLSKYFSTPALSRTEAAQNHTSTRVRQWSGLTELVQRQSPIEQLKWIEFVMGRTDSPPEILKNNETQHSLAPRKMVMSQRDAFSNASQFERLSFVNGLFHGPNAELAKDGNLELVLNRILSDIAPEKRAAASDLAHAAMKAEGINKSFLLARILSKKPDTANPSKIGEDWILQSILESYGVPGLKLAQYLAFTGEFKEYESSLSKYQDSAPAPGYYDLLSYIQDHLQFLLNLDEFKITKLLGAGTVNLAIEYTDLKTGEMRVINIPREDIAQKSEVDFERFQNFMVELAKRSTPERDYSFLVGLSKIIASSVKLEFDRQAVSERQSDAETIYPDVRSGDWTIQTVSPHGRFGQAILMDRAPGVTARKVLESDPQIYKSAIASVYDYEYGLLFSSKTPDGMVRLANPDLHDGQMLIDVPARKITVIDFGQAVRLDQMNADFGFDLVSITQGVKAKSKALENLQGWQKKIGYRQLINDADLAPILKINDPMDKFVRIISLFGTKGSNIDLAAIHFVLSMNRLSKLGTKAGRYPTVSFGTALMAREIRSSWMPKALEAFSFFKPKKKNMCAELLEIR